MNRKLFSKFLEENNFDLSRKILSSIDRDVMPSLVKETDWTHLSYKQQQIEAYMEEMGRQESSSVFIVHGHDNELKESVARFVEKLGLRAIILHEQSNRGMAIMQKLVANSNVQYAIILMTPDDEGRKKGEADLSPRARQNVVLEFGFFAARLGPDRVSALVKGGVERPSDMDGLIYISADSETWKMEIMREFRSANIVMDVSNAI